MNAGMPPKQMWSAGLLRALIWVRKESLAPPFILAFLLLSGFYRATLSFAASRSSEGILGHTAVDFPALGSLQFLCNDLLTGVCLTVLALVIEAFHKRFHAALFQRRYHPWPVVVVLGLALEFCAVAMFMHCRLLVEFQRGLTFNMLRNAWAQLDLMDLVRMVPGTDWLALALPALLFLTVIWCFTKRHQLCELLLLVLVNGVVLWSAFPPQYPLRTELTASPLHYFTADAVRQLARTVHAREADTRNLILPGEAQLRTVRLVDEAFVSRTPTTGPVVELPARRKKPWNVLFFIMESTGAEYVFDTTEGNAVPMPFLKQLSETGLNLRRHYATANSSAEAMFSLFTGLYPRSGNWAAGDEGLRVPTLNRFLGPDYHSFFVHPVSMSLAFPKAVLVNNGLKELHDRSAIPSHGLSDFDPQARNEFSGVNHLLEQIDHAGAPFCAFYMSFVPHHPYNDYGEEYAIFPSSGNQRRQYYNNLRVLDSAIRRIHEHLAKRGLLDDTILAFVGDHSEAFGQHSGVWKHGGSTYDETFRTPMIFWQPAVFPVMAVDQYTSHVDVLPTLLDALGVQFNERLLQGQSLFRDQHARYIFLRSRFDDQLAVIDPNGIKVTTVPGKNHFQAYDLARDPAEKTQLPSMTFPFQREALLKFRNAQPVVFDGYNGACASGRDFHGQKHPSYE